MIYEQKLRVWALVGLRANEEYGLIISIQFYFKKIFKTIGHTKNDSENLCCVACEKTLSIVVVFFFN